MVIAERVVLPDYGKEKKQWKIMESSKTANIRRNIKLKEFEIFLRHYSALSPLPKEESFIFLAGQ